MIPMLFQAFLPCYYGTEITIMSEQLSSSFYQSEWLEEDRLYKSSAKIFMEFVKKPIKISSFGVFEISLGNFMRVCNSAYSLFAIFKEAT